MILDRDLVNILNKYKAIKVGLSCGLDSTVLLHKLASIPSLRSKLMAVHVNHGLSKNADRWQAHGEAFCQQLSIPLIVRNVSIAVTSSLEDAAREARYAVFMEVLQESECIVLAHHQNDQAETLLFNLLRGTGIDGLAGIPRHRVLGRGELVRPLLGICREDLSQYAIEHGLVWIDDESNTNLDFSRNYIRHAILPLITKKWPHALQNISDCADKCEAARDNLMQLALFDCPKLFSIPLQLELNFVHCLTQERIINVLRAWFRYNKIAFPCAHMYPRIINEVIFARIDKIPKLMLGKFSIRRYRDRLYIVNNSENFYQDVEWKNFPDPLYLQDGRCLTAELSVGDGVAVNEDGAIWVKFRGAGDVIRRNGQNKKLKKIFQEYAVLPWERDSLPLLFVDGEIKALVGLVYADSTNGFNRYKIIVINSER